MTLTADAANPEQWTGRGKVRAREGGGALEVVVEGLTTQAKYYKPLILEFIDGGGAPVFTMTEEHQVTNGEYITPGPPRALFNNICGGCHGSLSGSELDVAVSADALTGASVSNSRNLLPKMPQ